MPTRLLASGNRCLVKNAHPILECKHSSDGLDSSSHIKHKRPSLLTRSFVFGARDGNQEPPFARAFVVVENFQTQMERLPIGKRLKGSMCNLTRNKKHPTKWLGVICLVRETGIEPVRSPTRPSNVRVCLFRHSRMPCLLTQQRYYTPFFENVNTFFEIFLKNFIGAKIPLIMQHIIFLLLLKVDR